MKALEAWIAEALHKPWCEQGSGNIYSCGGPCSCGLDDAKLELASASSQTITHYDPAKLASLINWAVNGPEHGVITSDQWRQKCKELCELMRSLGMRPSGQWSA